MSEHYSRMVSNIPKKVTGRRISSFKLRCIFSVSSVPSVVSRFERHMPEQGKNPFGRPVFQKLQYSDTPAQPLVRMQFTDTKPEIGKIHQYRVIAVNTVGLMSK